MRKSPVIKRSIAKPKKLARGFNVMTPEQRQEIARMGGTAISRNRKHMAAIGQRGGLNSHGGRPKK